MATPNSISLRSKLLAILLFLVTLVACARPTSPLESSPSAPLSSPSSSTPTFSIQELASLTLPDLSGSVAGFLPSGIVVWTYDPHYRSDPWNELDLYPHMRILLVTMDGSRWTELYHVSEGRWIEIMPLAAEDLVVWGETDGKNHELVALHPLTGMLQRVTAPEGTHEALLVHQKRIWWWKSGFQGSEAVIWDLSSAALRSFPIGQVTTMIVPTTDRELLTVERDAANSDILRVRSLESGEVLEEYSLSQENSFAGGLAISATRIAWSEGEWADASRIIVLDRLRKTRMIVTQQVSWPGMPLLLTDRFVGWINTNGNPQTNTYWLQGFDEKPAQLLAQGAVRPAMVFRDQIALVQDDAMQFARPAVLHLYRIVGP